MKISKNIPAILFALSLLLVSQVTFSQRETIVKARVSPTDTLITVKLPAYKIQGNKQFMSENVKEIYYDTRIFRRDVERVHPYAQELSDTYNMINEELGKANGRKERKKIVKQYEAQLKQQFEDRINNLTKQQGVFFVKLIYRETGKTCYHLMKEMRNGSSAFFWQRAAKLNGINLKLDYRPEERDQKIERIITDSI